MASTDAYSEAGELGYGTALLAAFVAGIVGGFVPTLLHSFMFAQASATGDRNSYLFGSLLGLLISAVAVVWFLERTGWKISFVAATASMALGTIFSLAGVALTRQALLTGQHHAGGAAVVPIFGVGFGLIGGMTGILGLLAEAWLIQNCATRGRHRNVFSASDTPAAGAAGQSASTTAPTTSAPSHEDYGQRLRRVQSSVADITRTLEYCSSSELAGRVSEGLATLKQLSTELDATIPPTMTAEGPQSLLSRGLGELGDDLVSLVQRAEGRGEGQTIDSLTSPDRLRDVEEGTGLHTIRQALELLHALGFDVSGDAV